MSAAARRGPYRIALRIYVVTVAAVLATAAALFLVLTLVQERRQPPMHEMFRDVARYAGSPPAGRRTRRSPRRWGRSRRSSTFRSLCIAGTGRRWSPRGRPPRRRSLRSSATRSRARRRSSGARANSVARARSRSRCARRARRSATSSWDRPNPPGRRREEGLLRRSSSRSRSSWWASGSRRWSWEARSRARSIASPGRRPPSAPETSRRAPGWRERTSSARSRGRSTRWPTAWSRCFAGRPSSSRTWHTSCGRRSRASAVALDLAADGDAAVARESLAEIGEDLSELEALVSDILASARMDLAGNTASGAPPLHRAAVDVVAVVSQAAERLRHRHPDRRIEVELGADVPSVDGDAALLRRALDNLLDNARKYSPPESEIRVRAARRGSDAAIEVVDRGEGIAAEDLDRIFTPFFRADRSRTRATGGVGLGLALSKRIVEAHGGTLVASSAPGAGTTMTVALPGRS